MYFKKFTPFLIFFFLFIVFNTVPILAQWTLTSSTGISSNLQHKPTLIAGGSYIFLYAKYRSSDKGDSWQTITYPGDGTNQPSAQYYFDNKLFSGLNSSQDCIFYSTDNGSTWQNTAGGPVTTEIYGFYDYKGYLFAYCPKGIYKSTDNGLSWSLKGTDQGVIASMTSLNNNLYSAANNGVYKSTDDGETWTQVNNGITIPYGLEIWHLGNTLYFFTQGGKIFTSTDEGSNWAMTDFPIVPKLGTLGNITNVIRFNNHFYIRGTEYSTSTLQHESFILYSEDEGTNWTDITGNLPVSTTMSDDIVEFNGNLFVAYYNLADKFYRRDLSTITDIKVQNIIPSNYQLSQNYPNPFNPSTNINFSIPKSSFVTLKIYDALGKEVASLVNQELAVGTYSYNFDASKLSSGIYFYRITALDFIQTKKMLLLK